MRGGASPCARCAKRNARRAAGLAGGAAAFAAGVRGRASVAQHGFGSRVGQHLRPLRRRDSWPPLAVR
eukprot:671132-Alexandrium_andersonii.AAC.1